MKRKIVKGQVQPILKTLAEVREEKLSARAAYAIAKNVRIMSGEFDAIFSHLMMFEQRKRESLQAEQKGFMEERTKAEPEKPPMPLPPDPKKYPLLTEHRRIWEEIRDTFGDEIEMDLHPLMAVDFVDVKMTPLASEVMSIFWEDSEDKPEEEEEEQNA